jgi:hypothetical protein
MNNKLEGLWKETVVLKSEALSWRFPEVLRTTTKISYNKPVIRQRLEPGTFQIKNTSRSSKYSDAISVCRSFVWFDFIELCST